MENLLKFLIEQIVDNKEAIEIVAENESDKVTILTALVSKDDIGKVIGKSGKVATSIRTIIKTAGNRNGKKFIVKIGEKE